VPDLVRGLRPGDTARAELVVDAVRFILMGLEAHHTSEDEYLSLAELDKMHLLRAFSALTAVATPEEQRTLITKAPLPARLSWRLSGRRSHVRWEARLRGV